MTTPASRYDYTFDPSGDSTAARVCRLAGHGRRVLELGCAAGAMSAVLARHYHCTVTGVEYDAKAAGEAARHCETVITASLEDDAWLEPLKNQRFDTVIAADVLEHLHDPGRCLRQLRTLIGDDGRIVISVPNLAHSGVLAALLCGDFPYVDVGLLDRTHVHFFTAASLRRTLEANGYEIVHSETVDAGAWHAEFARYWNALPPALKEWLENNPAGRAFQIVVVARPTPPDAPRPAMPDKGAAAALPAAQGEWLQQFPDTASWQREAAARDLDLAELRARCAALESELQTARSGPENRHGGLRHWLGRLLGRR